MLEIALASKNPGQLAEIQSMISDFRINLIPQATFNLPEVTETGSTFVENALIKPRHVARYTKLPTLEDDSGLT